MATWRYVCIEILKGPKYPHCFKICTLSGQLFGYFRKAAQCLWLEVWNWIPLMLADYTLLFRLLKRFVLLHSHRLSDNAICKLLRLGQAGVLMPPVQCQYDFYPWNLQWVATMIQAGSGVPGCFFNTYKLLYQNHTCLDAHIWYYLFLVLCYQVVRM